MTNLRHSDATLSSELLLNLLRRVGIGEIRIEILVEDLGRLLAEVPAFPAGIEESRTKDHDGFTSALLQLNLERKKTAIESGPLVALKAKSNGIWKRILSNEKIEAILIEETLSFDN